MPHSARAPTPECLPERLQPVLQPVLTAIGTRPELPWPEVGLDRLTSRESVTVESDRLRVAATVDEVPGRNMCSLEFRGDLAEFERCVQPKVADIAVAMARAMALRNEPVTWLVVADAHVGRVACHDSWDHLERQFRFIPCATVDRDLLVDAGAVIGRPAGRRTFGGPGPSATMDRGGTLMTLKPAARLAIALLGCSAAWAAAATSVRAADTWVGLAGPPERGTTLVNAVGMRMAWIPPGSFTMGSPFGEAGRSSNEGPQHQVVLARGLWLAAHEVTQSVFERVMGSNPSSFKGADLPVHNVTYADAAGFCARLNEQDPRAAGARGYRYALPSESVWEYGCRAGTTGPAHADRLQDVAWFRVNVERGPRPVGTRLPNGFGLFDMLGNVREWCSDGSRDDFAGAPDDGRSWPLERAEQWRVVRGGSWYEEARACRAASRSGYPATDSSFFTGFRPMAVPTEYYVPEPPPPAPVGWRSLDDPKDYIPPPGPLNPGRR